VNTADRPWIFQICAAQVELHGVENESPMMIKETLEKVPQQTEGSLGTCQPAHTQIQTCNTLQAHRGRPWALLVYETAGTKSALFV